MHIKENKVITSIEDLGGITYKGSDLETIVINSEEIEDIINALLSEASLNPNQFNFLHKIFGKRIDMDKIKPEKIIAKIREWQVSRLLERICDDKSLTPYEWDLIQSLAGNPKQRLEDYLSRDGLIKVINNWQLKSRPDYEKTIDKIISGYTLGPDDFEMIKQAYSLKDDIADEDLVNKIREHFVNKTLNQIETNLDVIEADLDAIEKTLDQIETNKIQYKDNINSLAISAIEIVGGYAIFKLADKIDDKEKWGKKWWAKRAVKITGLGLIVHGIVKQL